MTSLSKKYILVDDWGRPILPKYYKLAECPECLTLFMKRNNKHKFCSRNCAKNCWFRENRQRKIMAV